jgi:signal peptidase
VSRLVRARIRRAIELAIGLLVIGLWALTLRPVSLGGPATYVVVRGDSMLPAYHSGDLVILQGASAFETGDAVGYRVPAGEVGAGHIVLHRIVGGDAGRGFVLQGDNNPAPDPWQPSIGDVAGRAAVTLPGAGRVIAFIHQPAVAGALAVSLLVMILVARWPAKSGQPREPRRPARPLLVPEVHSRGSAQDAAHRTARNVRLVPLA